MDDRRRSPRVAATLALRLFKGDEVTDCTSENISEHGALLLSPKPFYPGANLTVANPKRKTRVHAWVVRVLPGEKAGEHRIAIEFLEPAPRFWGKDYDPR